MSLWEPQRRGEAEAEILDWLASSPLYGLGPNWTGLDRKRHPIQEVTRSSGAFVAGSSWVRLRKFSSEMAKFGPPGAYGCLRTWGKVSKYFRFGLEYLIKNGNWNGCTAPHLMIKMFYCVKCGWTPVNTCKAWIASWNCSSNGAINSVRRRLTSAVSSKAFPKACICWARRVFHSICTWHVASRTGRQAAMKYAPWTFAQCQIACGVEKSKSASQWQTILNTSTAKKCVRQDQDFCVLWGKYLFIRGQTGRNQNSAPCIGEPKIRTLAIPWVPHPENGGDPYIEKWQSSSKIHKEGIINYK